MAVGNAARLDGLVGYALAQHDAAGGAPVLVVEKAPGRRSVTRGRPNPPREVEQLVRRLDRRTARLARWGAVVWHDDDAGPEARGERTRYAYCVTPDHRQGLLLAQRYAGGRAVGDPEPVDREDLPLRWRPARLTPDRSPVQRFRARPRVALLGPTVAFLVGMFVANALIRVADRLGGTRAAGATVVDRGFQPTGRGGRYSVDIVADDGAAVHLDSGDLREVHGATDVGDHLQVLYSGFTGRPVAVEAAGSSVHLAGGPGEPVGWLLLSLAIVWVLAKALTWPRLRWSLVRVAPLGIVTGVLLSLLGGT